MLEYFNPSSTNPRRAQQAWQILVGQAHNRQTITYKYLSELMYEVPSPGVMDKMLGHIAYFCEENGLPQLNVLVVASKSGRPGEEIPLDPEYFDNMREQVYNFDWYDVVPPTADQLSEAYKKN